MYSLLIKNSLTKWASLPPKFGFLLQLFLINKLYDYSSDFILYIVIIVSHKTLHIHI